MSIITTKLISGFTIKTESNGKKDIIKHLPISREDVELTERIFSLGSSIVNMESDIINLYHKHINPNLYICGRSCLGQLQQCWLRYYELYKKELEKDENLELMTWRMEVIENIINEKRLRS